MEEIRIKPNDIDEFQRCVRKKSILFVKKRGLKISFKMWKWIIKINRIELKFYFLLLILLYANLFFIWLNIYRLDYYSSILWQMGKVLKTRVQLRISIANFRLLACLTFLG